MSDDSDEFDGQPEDDFVGVGPRDEDEEHI